jgi:acyloxyacyl hydrolase
MSYASFIWICICAVVLIPVIDGRSTALKNGVNGGVDCAVCSVVLGLVDKLAIVHNKSIEHALELLCNLFPPPYKSFCTTAVQFLGKFKGIIQSKIDFCFFFSQVK